MKSKTCSVCAKYKPISEYYKKESGLHGVVAECKVCSRARVKAYERNNKAKIRKNDTGPSRRYNQLIQSARKRNLPVEISKEQYKKYTDNNPNCYYCDASMENTVGSGLNRVDSSKGYSLSNIKRCCRTCNVIMSNFTKEELQIRVYKIIKRMK